MTPGVRDLLGPSHPLTGDVRRRLWFVVGVAALGALIVLTARWGPDWAAQQMRAWLAGHDGPGLWTNRWYSGTALWGYSVLYPIVGAVVGVGTTGVASVAVTAWCASGFGPPVGWRGWGFRGSVAAGLFESLLIGQVPFLLGAAFGMAGVSALMRGRRAVVVAALAAACSLSSPLAGMFLLLSVPAFAVALGWRRASTLFGAASGVAVSIAVGGGAGTYPMPVRTWAAVAVLCVGLVVVSRGDRAWRIFAASYLLADTTCVLVGNPIGGNIDRLGKLIAAPVAFALLRMAAVRARAVGVTLIAVCVVWSAAPFVSSVAEGWNDPSRQSSYYLGVARYLGTVGPARVEVPALREHWESLYMARQVDLARGWERQSDIHYNQVLYHPLTASAYRGWLVDNAISYVALADAPLDYGARAEQQLLRRPPSYLTPVWRDAHWRVWRVTAPAPLVSGAATLADYDQTSLVLNFRTAGRAVVRVHASRLWRIVDGTGCLQATPDGWLEVVAASPGPRTVAVRVSTQLLTGFHDCDARPVASIGRGRPG